MIVDYPIMKKVNCKGCGKTITQVISSHVDYVSGNYDTRCNECDEKLRKEYDKRHAMGSNLNRCKGCGGTGKVMGYTCVECNGTGKQ